VKAPRVRDRTGTIRSTSSILPPYLRRTKTIEELLPWLYLKGISTGDFGEALTALLGRQAPGLSAGTISRLKAVWQHEHARWERRELGSTLYVYLWVDGIHFGVRLEEANQCLLVVIGATAEDKKELLALTDGFRESEESWKDVLLDLKRRGLTVDPRLAIGDGALGFWKALPQVFGHTRTQRCWVHKTAYNPKYPKAADCLAMDKTALLAFFDFPAPHWHHIRTTNPIESTFATVRLGTAKTRGCVSRASILSMVFKLAKSAEGRWLRLRGTEQIAKLMHGVQFKNGVETPQENRQEIAA
jgi:transposase-like protein